MNPFTNTLNRRGYLVCNLLILAVIIAFGILIDATKADHAGAYWPGLRMVWGVGVFAAFIYMIIRRLQNANLSFWWVLLTAIPFVGTLLWLILFFIPPKQTATLA